MKLQRTSLLVVALATVLLTANIARAQDDTTAKRLRSPSTVMGFVGGESHDSYVIRASKGQILASTRPADSDAAPRVYTANHNASPSTDDDASNELDRVEPKLRGILPGGWSITRGPNGFTLARDEKVFIYSSLNWPVFSDKSMDEMVREYGHEVVYRLTLRFVPRLRPTQYAALKREYKACYIENKPGPTFTIEKWARAQECYHTKQLPVYYTSRSTIYVDQPDWWSELKLYPETAANESNRVNVSMDKFFSRYDKAHARH